MSYILVSGRSKRHLPPAGSGAATGGGGSSYTRFANQPTWPGATTKENAWTNLTTWNNNSVNGAATITTIAGAPGGDTSVLQQRYRNGVASASTSEATQYTAISGGRIYIACDVMLDPLFYGNTGSGTNKLDHVFVNAAIGGNNHFLSVSGGGTDPLYWSASIQGMTGYATNDGVTNNGAMGDQAPGNLVALEAERGFWYHVERIINPVAGTIEMWVNGVKTHWRAGLNFDSTSLTEYKMDNTWGGNTGTIPYDFDYWTAHTRLYYAA